MGKKRTTASPKPSTELAPATGRMTVVPAKGKRLEFLRASAIGHLAEASEIIAEAQDAPEPLAELIAAMAQTLRDVIEELQDDEFQRCKQRLTDEMIARCDEDRIEADARAMRRKLAKKNPSDAANIREAELQIGEAIFGASQRRTK